MFRRKIESEMADLLEYEAKYEILQYTHTHTHEEVKILLDNWYLVSKTKFITLDSQDQPVAKIEWWQRITHKMVKRPRGRHGGIRRNCRTAIRILNIKTRCSRVVASEFQETQAVSIE